LTTVNNGLTDQEKKVLALTADVANEYIKLEAVHPSEMDEMVYAIHQIQHLIARRVARRVDPDVWS
jgi:predicted transcriptional regulator